LWRCRVHQGPKPLRELLGYILTNDEPANLGALSARQREILGYVVEGADGGT